MFCSALRSPYMPAFKNLVTRDWTAGATLAPLAKSSLSGSSGAPFIHTLQGSPGTCKNLSFCLDPPTGSSVKSVLDP